MKRSYVIRRLRKAANEAGLDFEITVIKLFKQYETVLGRDWWRR